MPSLLRVAVLGLAVPAVLALTAVPAQAHNELLSSTPTEGDHLAAAPVVVELKFAEATDPRFVKIAATGPDGTSVAAGGPRVSGAVVRQPISASAASGKYTVTYRVVSKDGHPVQGTLTFSATAPTPTSTTTESTVVSLEPAAKPVPTERNGWLLYPVAGAAVLALFGVALTLRARARRIR
jgi:methionine-rich copper-binding protein CopC